MFAPLLLLALVPTIIAIPPRSDHDSENMMPEEFNDGIRNYNSADDLILAKGHGRHEWNLRDNFDLVKSPNKRRGNMLYDTRRNIDSINLPWKDCDEIEVEPTNDAPDAFDWRDYDVVSPVKNLGKCNIGTNLFTTVENVESQYAIKHKQILDLSAQQLLDCNKYYNYPCRHGKYPPKAESTYSTMLVAGGLMDSCDYPYTAEQDRCKVDISKIVVNVTGCNSYDVDDEQELKEVLYKVGPLTIGFSMAEYKGGIVTDCFSKDASRVYGTLVGYGTENGTDFWSIKLSYGSHYGEDGYARIQRGRGCLYIGSVVLSAVLQ